MALGLCGLAAASAQDWSRNTGQLTSEFAESKAVCGSVLNREPPAADRPDAGTAASLKGCDSEKLYYGIGMKADPVRARQCAFLQMRRDPPHFGFAGQAMLMIIYANGVGAKRDLDVATHLACGLDAGADEMNQRVLHLARLKAKGWSGHDFGFCDDASSSGAMGACTSHEAILSAPAREARIVRLTRGLKGRDRKAFVALRRDHAAFARDSADEVDPSPRLRWMNSVNEEEKARDDFVDLLQRLASGRVPAATHARLAASEAKLNRTYRKALAEADPDLPGSIWRANLGKAQRAWLRYRDSFLAFAAVKYPSVPRDSLVAWLTERRTKMLESLGED
ncbi:MAG TPA: lysozyme inhibitor LprI family protein [Allosphingosinicella sp.]|nr:lysozyme inhibitor LprI family protein [Allosphingosinicella sp.]